MPSHKPKPTPPSTFILLGSALLALGSLAWRLLNSRQRPARPTLPDPLHMEDQKDPGEFADVKTVPGHTALRHAANKASERPYFE